MANPFSIVLPTQLAQTSSWDSLALMASVSKCLSSKRLVTSSKKVLCAGSVSYLFLNIHNIRVM